MGGLLAGHQEGDAQGVDPSGKLQCFMQYAASKLFKSRILYRSLCIWQDRQCINYVLTPVQVMGCIVHQDLWCTVVTETHRAHGSSGTILTITHGRSPGVDLGSKWGQVVVIQVHLEVVFKARRAQNNLFCAVSFNDYGMASTD